MKYNKIHPTLNNNHFTLKLLSQCFASYVNMACKYELHYIRHNTQLEDLMSERYSLVNGMMTHRTIDTGLLDRYMVTIAYGLQRKQTNVELVFQNLYEYNSEGIIISLNTADELICKYSY